MTENIIFSTSVYTNLFAYLFERNWHYFVIGVAVLGIFGLYYHIQGHDASTGNTLKDVHGIDLDKISILLSRFYLASVFLIMGGLHGAFEFVPQAAVEMTPEAVNFVAGLVGTGYLLPAVKIIELLVGITFLFGLWMPLTLIVAAPIVINIGLYHLFLDWSGLPIALLMGVTMVYLTHRHRSYFKPLFSMKASLSPLGMTKEEAKEMHEIMDGEDISYSQNLPHFDPDKMARKAFILVAVLCFGFMAAGAIVLNTSADQPGEKSRGFINK